MFLTKEQEQKLRETGLIESTKPGEYGRWIVPAGFIAVTEDGPAEEYLPGFYRHLDGLRVDRDDLTVSAVMADSEGYGERHRIVGVIPVTRKETVRSHWTDGQTWEEIQAILQADEEGG